MIMLLRGSRFFLRFIYVFPFDKGLVNCRIEAGVFLFWLDYSLSILGDFLKDSPLTLCKVGDGVGFFW